METGTRTCAVILNNTENDKNSEKLGNLKIKSNNEYSKKTAEKECI